MRGVAEWVGLIVMIGWTAVALVYVAGEALLKWEGWRARRRPALPYFRYRRRTRCIPCGQSWLMQAKKMSGLPLCCPVCGGNVVDADRPAELNDPDRVRADG